MITIEIRDAEKANAGMAEVEIFCDDVRERTQLINHLRVTMLPSTIE